jgi:predicted GH43/DUF377 family glycosyl hydrolase
VGAEHTPFGFQAGSLATRPVNRRGFLQSLALLALPVPAQEPVPRELATPHKVGRLVIAPSAEAGAFDSQGADVPFVFRHDGMFYMTYVGFDGEGYQTGLAVSSNLLDWRKEGVILPRDARHPVLRYNAALTWILRENDVFSPGRLRKVRGRYLGVYHAYPKPGYEEGPAVIGLCWSRDLKNWEVEEPCLRPDDGAGWENGGLYKACILEDAGTYYLYYNAKDRGERWKEQTGFATSRGLKTWTRYEANPTLTNGPAGSPDEIFASDPCVLRYRNRWAIFYYWLDAKGVARDLLALSPDLRRTVKCSVALIDVGPPGSVDSKYAHKPSVVFHRGTLYHFYCAVSNEFGRGISVATSRPA